MTAEQLALSEAIKIIGSQAKTAQIVGVSQPDISYALHKKGRADAEWCLPLERATGGQVPRHRLRPDLYPLETPTTSEAA